MKKVIWLIFVAIIVLFLFDLFLIRAFSERELDDVTPGVGCAEDLVLKSDTLWIVPVFEGERIDENEEWCKYILGFDKKLGMHGVYHTYEEFGVLRDSDYVSEGVEIFENCFGFKPELFKPPQLVISPENRDLLVREGFKVKALWNQILHKAYHCSDSGRFSNRFIGLF